MRQAREQGKRHVKIEPHARLTVYEYGKRIDDWYANLDEKFKTHTMKPGAIGATVDKITGEILNITSQGQTATAGLRIGWHLREVDGQNYSEQQLAMCIVKERSYSITVEKHVPTVEQRVVLEKVRNRVLTEFRLWKEGCDVPRSDAERLAEWPVWMEHPDPNSHHLAHSLRCSRRRKRKRGRAPGRRHCDRHRET